MPYPIHPQPDTSGLQSRVSDHSTPKKAGHLQPAPTPKTWGVLGAGSADTIRLLPAQRMRCTVTTATTTLPEKTRQKKGNRPNSRQGKAEEVQVPRTVLDKGLQFRHFTTKSDEQRQARCQRQVVGCVFLQSVWSHSLSNPVENFFCLDPTRHANGMSIVPCVMPEGLQPPWRCSVRCPGKPLFKRNGKERKGTARSALCNSEDCGSRSISFFSCQWSTARACPSKDTNKHVETI